ncbi:ABC transporter permease [Shouchella clausii]|uniref:ABC transporter permease n=1 Tax=Shouchella TaxID=2893057 RepID=UPI0004E67DEC|nr:MULTISPECIES: ABC transporter permease [Shouchella]ALA53385.1 Dipeptide transport system permease protein DppB [Shouchella clausii]MBU3233260.1 ABC transporter permease [Shouchella clausii]MBU3263900.1 ABC transporter permease [Shouchella clausii]MBU3509238.1 ABC transporter permease [Shouchella clausii]MBU3535550.1 ABC transporter permease [Shouchella clausii]
MRKYLLWRVLQIIPVLFLISIFVFALLYLAGDPVALMLPEDATQEQVDALRESLGLDQPFYIQYLSFVGDVIQGDFGYSYRYSQPALPIVLERLPATFELAFASMIVAVLIAVPLGILSATKRNTALDVFISGASVLGKAMPNFWLGIMLILMLAITYPFFPVSGSGSMAHLILPAITLGTGCAAEMTRVLRSSMLETLNQDYVRTAVSKGVKNFFVVYKHAFRNALIPFITITFLQVSTLVSGALITEVVFSWPGLGQLLIQAINGRDMAVVQATVFIVAFIVIVVNLMADVLYRVLDPRIQFD